MSGTTTIEWADKVWNPVVGCTKISEGCRNCYAKTLHDMRHQAYLAGKKLPYQYSKPFEQVQLLSERLEDPARWQKPSRVFVNSMSDLFHPAVPRNFLLDVWHTMKVAQQHTFLVLTKRPDRMAEFVSWLVDDEPATIRKNIWLGVSVENQAAADERIPWLLQTPAAVRFVSCEPLLGPVDLNKIQAPNDDRPLHFSAVQEMTDDCFYSASSILDWVIAGYESGPNARPGKPEWVKSLRDQAVSAGVPFFFKSWGQYLHLERGQVMSDRKVASRLLDGREWNEYPEA